LAEMTTPFALLSKRVRRNVAKLRAAADCTCAPSPPLFVNAESASRFDRFNVRLATQCV
jgi:hypothetical protein